MPTSRPICPPLSDMTASEFCFTNPANPRVPADPKKSLSYGRILNLGVKDSYPILTFTAVGPDCDIVVAEPSREYLRTISSGIRETFADMAIERVCDYFLGCDGVRDKISKEELGRWLGLDNANQFAVANKGLMDMNPTRDRERYEASVKALQFELEQFWKRSLFFWGFISAAFVAYATSESHPSLQAAIASFGFVCSVVWTLANRGSKFWYEDWERHLKAAELCVTGSLYGSPAKEEVGHDDKRGLLERIGRLVWSGKRYSPSKLAIALSDYIAIFWFCILAYKSVSLVKSISATVLWLHSREGFAVIFVALSFVFAVLLRWLCHTSKD